MTLAHAAHGDLLGAPDLFLEIGLVVLVGLVTVALRAGWPRPRLEHASAGWLLPSWSAAVGRGAAVVGATLGSLVWLTTLIAALFATDDPPENLAPFVVSLPFLLGGGVVLSLVFDGWWRAASPFATLAGAARRRASAEVPPPWVAPVMLGSYLWLATAFHDGGEVRPIGIWLALYTLAGIAGTVRWGTPFAETGDGFAAVFGSVGHVAPIARDGASGRIRLRWPPTGLGGTEVAPGTVAALLLATGAAAFSGLRSMDWWQLEVVGGRTEWSRTMVDTLGLAFTVGVVAVLWFAGQALGRTASTALVPVGAGVVVAFLLTDLTMRSIDVVALVSDPFGEGWDLLGTADWFPDLAWMTSPRLAWGEIAAIATGAVLGAIAAHDRARADALGAVPDVRRAALAAGYAEIGAATAVAFASVVLLLR